MELPKGGEIAKGIESRCTFAEVVVINLEVKDE
jgi:hypothetical protein